MLFRPLTRGNVICAFFYESEQQSRREAREAAKGKGTNLDARTTCGVIGGIVDGGAA